MIYEKEPVEIDSANAELEDRYVWDMEHALNVWVCPITNVTRMNTAYSQDSRISLSSMK